MNVINIQSATVNHSTLVFIQGYNTSEALASTRERVNLQNFQAIGQYQVAGQMTIVLATATFLNPQAKQTFKRTIQYLFSKVFSGRALMIKGNTCTVATLADGQTVNDRGNIVNVKTEADIAKEKADKADRDRLLLEAEQNEIKLEQERLAKEQALATAANLIKKQNNHDKEIKQVESKAKVAIDLLSKQVADLTRQLEYAKHETASTVSAYNDLKSMIMGKTTIQALRAKVSGMTVFQPMTGAERQAVITDHISAQA